AGEGPDLLPVARSGLYPPVSAGHVKKPDLLGMRPVEHLDRLGGGLQYYLAALLREITSGDRCTLPIWPEPRMSCSHPLSKTNFASSLSEHVRGAVVLLRQLLLPLSLPARGANDHVVLIGLSVDRDGSECGPFDLHGLILVPGLRTRL